MANEKITFAVVSKPWLYRLKDQLPVVLPYVDRVVIVIGEDDQETKDYLKSLGPKVECYFNPWNDSFSDQYNIYLDQITDGWVLICDDDEIPSEEFLQTMGEFVNASEYGNRFCFVEARCHDIHDGVKGEAPAHYWRQIFFRYNSAMRYLGGAITGCHQYIAGHQNGRGVKTDLTYFHSKSNLDMHRNSARNYYTYGIWPHGSREGLMGPEWLELRACINKCHREANTFPDVDRLMVAGQLHEDVQTLLIKQYNEYRDHPDYNELKGFVRYLYDFLQPQDAEKFGYVR